MRVDPIAETYEDVKGLIYHTVQRFITRFGGEFDELVSISHEVFMGVCRANVDSAKGSFTNYLVNSIWHRLIDNNVDRSRKRNVRCAVSIDAETEGGGTLAASIESRQSPTFNLVEFAQQLSQDAAIVLKLVVDAPQEILLDAKWRGADNRTSWRKAVKDYLMEMGWAVERVRKSFNEISGVLAR